MLNQCQYKQSIRFVYSMVLMCHLRAIFDLDGRKTCSWSVSSFFFGIAVYSFKESSAWFQEMCPSSWDHWEKWEGLQRRDRNRQTLYCMCVYVFMSERQWSKTGKSFIKSKWSVDLAALSPDSNTEDYSSNGHSHHTQLYTVVLCHVISIMLVYEKIMDRGSRAVKAPFQSIQLNNGSAASQKAVWVCLYIFTA